MAFIDDLNKAQQAAVLHKDGPHLVIAGAGSGKTRVLTYKIAYLLSQGVPAYNIMALTFTNKAAREMKTRISTLVGEEVARNLWMGTFHSLCARLLRQEADHLGYTKTFTIYDTADSKNLIKQIVKELQEDEKVYKPGDVLGAISEAKNMMLSAHDYGVNMDFTVRDRRLRRYRMAEIYQIYQNRLRHANAMDFDDLLFNMNVLMQKCDDVREKYQSHFEYLLVDEYQDTNYSQYLIVKSLAAPQNNICVVGDDAQSIYSFRGADIRNILTFQKEYEPAKLFKLEQNYRSTQTIVNAANSLIEKNRNRIPKTVFSENGKGEKISVSSQIDDRAEASYVAREVRKMQGEGRSLEDCAVLYRTNSQSRTLEDAFRKEGIAYRIYGGLSYYQRKEVKDVLAYFRLLVNPSDDEAFLRIINWPTRGIGATTIARVSELAHVHGLSMFEVAQRPDDMGLAVNSGTKKKLIQFAYLMEQMMADVRKKDAYELGDELLHKAGILTHLSMDKTQENIERLENVKELQSALREFVDRQINIKADAYLEDFLAEVSLLTDQDEQLDDETARVTLMTVHAAKGLEYGVVWITGMENGLFPSMYCTTEREIEEERRLFYVALTRAKDKCYLVRAQNRFRNGQTQIMSASPFIKDIDAAYLEESSPTPARTPGFHSSWFDDDAEWNRLEKFSFAEHAEDSRSRYDASYSRQRSSEPVGSVQASRPAGMTAVGKRYDAAEETSFESPFPVGTRIRHSKFGDGTVVKAYVSNESEKLDIEFDKSGKKTMILRFALPNLQRI